MDIKKKGAHKCAPVSLKQHRKDTQFCKTSKNLSSFDELEVKRPVPSQLRHELNNEHELCIWLQEMQELKRSIDYMEIEISDLMKTEQSTDKIYKKREILILLQRAFIEKWANKPEISVISNNLK